MNITDEQLSAFLDAELPEAEMEIIREQLIRDENLANRLADLAMVDEVVAMAYSTIDAQPVPESITALLQENKSPAAQIIPFPLWKRVQLSLAKPVAIAAGFALVIGFGIAQLIPSADTPGLQQVAAILDQSPSGVEQIVQGVHVKPRLTFVDKDGNYCRQFDRVDSTGATQNIACRKHDQWKINLSLAMEKMPEAGSYQTATGESVINKAVEEMAAGDFFDAQQESRLINQHWQK